MLSRSINYICEDRNLRFDTRLAHWLFQDGCPIAVSTDAALTVRTVHTDSGFADNQNCLNLVYNGFLSKVLVLTGVHSDKYIYSSKPIQIS